MLVLAMEFSRGGLGADGPSRRAADPEAGVTDAVTLLGGATAALPENGTEVARSIWRPPSEDKSCQEGVDQRGRVASDQLGVAEPLIQNEPGAQQITP